MRHPQEYQRRLDRALAYIARHLHREVTLNEVAAEACFSPYHFHRLFVALTGKTVAGHQRRLRLERAVQQLILEPQRPIGEIASELGFSTSQNFAKSFRLFYGHSPSSIRACGDFTRVDQLLRQHGPINLAAEPYRRCHPLRPMTTSDRSPTMQVNVIERPSQQIAYLRVNGPYCETMPAGFARLEQWAVANGHTDGDWLALYWDNPETTPVEQLRADVAVSVVPGSEVSGEVQLQTIPAGLYASHRCRVENGDFAAPWNALFGEWLPHSGYQPTEGPCFEHYLNDGRASGVWELVIYTPVRPL